MSMNLFFINQLITMAIEIESFKSIRNNSLKIGSTPLVIWHNSTTNIDDFAGKIYTIDM